MTYHFEESLRERNIARFEVEDTVRHHDKVTRQADGSYKAEKTIGTRIIVVIYDDKGKEKVIRTTWAKNLL